MPTPTFSSANPTHNTSHHIIVVHVRASRFCVLLLLPPLLRGTYYILAARTCMCLYASTVLVRAGQENKPVPTRCLHSTGP